MNLGLRILRATGIALGVVVGLPVAFVLWTNASYIRQDIRIDTGEIREVREGILWDSSPENIHETVVTPVLKAYGIGMKPQGNPWVFFNRVHAFARKGGDWPLEKMLLSHGDYPSEHLHYGEFLEAVAQYRNPQEAALWWKAMMTQKRHWRETQISRAHGLRDVLREKPFTSSVDFNSWYTDLMSGVHKDAWRAKLIPLFDELYTLYSTPPPKP